eukprot:5378127-Alexandrium_andersonii.AAC.1
MGPLPEEGYAFPRSPLSVPVAALAQVVGELAPQAVYSGMAHVVAADSGADDLGVPLLAADAPGQDLMVEAAHDLQSEPGRGHRPGVHFLFCDARRNPGSPGSVQTGAAGWSPG